MKARIGVGDRVVFSKAVIARTQHSEFASTFVGAVVKIAGATCDVDTGYSIRCVPTANLVKVKNGLILEA